MRQPRVTQELVEALHHFVDADLELRQAASGGNKYDRKVVVFDRAAEKVAAVARLAGFSARAAG